MESKHFSPIFPNPVSCFWTVISRFSQELFNRYPRDGIGNWLKETWEWHYLAFYIGWTELIHITSIAIGLTLLRIVLNSLILRPLPKYFNIIEQDAEKFPESAWKSIIYIVTWVWALCLCCVSDEMYFFKLDSHWEGYNLGNAIPNSIYWLYMLQMGFYFHCIYASVYLETIRRDFLALMFHHFLTLGLLFYSYGVRFHLIGLLVLFIHDIGDVTLEVSKTIVYFKTRNGVDHALPKFLADIGFAFFTIQWYVSAL
ncbi:PREDICTED: ceramide synthase 1-like [Amphimedon queenslandica]|uniref:TLC domain-containing protein n=1 Tax=Amphimedon queenslandica TaxID=400682 RepID=A0A1X7TWQ8_AMPQE|nr:PREDICTED: ceramide synthase 1-like [Amphimedon queenslandica]|eukprot:XP_019857335.1 PREDICTED: ceramide synthase 1-like [Amphimedon queenslandica]